MSSVEVGALRHRIIFGTERTLAYVSVLELGACWERALRRARVPLKYSQGFNPRPRMNFAAPLPVGCGSCADMLDITLEEPQSSESIARALQPVIPMDLTIVSIAPIVDEAPTLSEVLNEAEYKVWLSDVDPCTVKAAARNLLAVESIALPRRGRRHRGKTYDLRALIVDLKVVELPVPWVGLWMQLKARAGATGRPDEVLKAMDLINHPRRCYRTRLILQANSEEP